MASKLTDTELTVGTDGHKITGVSADGKALTDGVTLPKVTSSATIKTSEYSNYNLPINVTLDSQALKEAVIELRKIAHKHYTCECYSHCRNDDDHNDR